MQFNLSILTFSILLLGPLSLVNVSGEETRQLVHEFEVTDQIQGTLHGQSYSHEILNAGRDHWDVNLEAKEIVAQKTIQWRLVSALQFRNGQFFDLTPEDSNLPSGSSDLPGRVGRQKNSVFAQSMQLVRHEGDSSPELVPDFPGEVGLSFWSLPPRVDAKQWTTKCKPGFPGLNKEFVLSWKLDDSSQGKGDVRRYSFFQTKADDEFSVKGFLDVTNGCLVNARYVAEFKIQKDSPFQVEGTMTSVGRSRWVPKEDASLTKSDVVRTFERRKQYEVDVRKNYYRLLSHKIYPTSPADRRAEREQARALSKTILKYSESVKEKLPDEKEAIERLIALSDRVLSDLKEL